MSENKIINVLWTGGWDSTYRIVELSRRDVIVQPIYLYGQGRVSENHERKAMVNIISTLLKKDETRAKFKDIEYVHISNIDYDEHIESAYNQIISEKFMGRQYKWFASMAKNIQI